jgi:hypothetical protein
MIDSLCLEVSMKRLTILLVHHDPHVQVFRDDAGRAGYDVHVLVSKSTRDAMDCLGLGPIFHAVFVCYEMRGGCNTVDSCFVRECRAAGFGAVTRGKPLVAFSRDMEENQKLLMAGCNHVCHPDHITEFFLDFCGGIEENQSP